MASRWRYFSAISLSFFVGLTVSIVLFIYQISPLRDPTFMPNSGNAGTLISRFQFITEQAWIHWATLSAGVLAVNSTIVLWQQFRYRSRTEIALAMIGWLAIGFALFALIWMAFMAHLLSQWIID